MEKQINSIVSLCICAVLLVCITMLSGCQVNDAGQPAVASTYDHHEKNLKNENAVYSTEKEENFDATGRLKIRTGVFETDEYVISVIDNEIQKTADGNAPQVLTYALGDKVIEGILIEDLKDTATYAFDKSLTDEKINSVKENLQNNNYSDLPDISFITLNTKTGTVKCFSDRTKSIYVYDGVAVEAESVLSFIGEFLASQGLDINDYAVTRKPDNNFESGFYRLERWIGDVAASDVIDVHMKDGAIILYDRCGRNNGDYNSISSEAAAKLISDEACKAVIAAVTELYADVDEVKNIAINEMAESQPYQSRVLQPVRYMFTEDGELAVLFYVDVYYEHPLYDTDSCIRIQTDVVLTLK